jgi:arylsulfatase A-like enzyme
VVETPVASIDIFPTVLDLMGLPPLPGAEGRSARPLIEAAIGSEPPPPDLSRPAFAALDRSWAQRGASPNRLASVATDEERLIRALDQPAPLELFALTSDPQERTNVAGSEPAVRDRLADLLSQHLAQPGAAWGAATPVQLDRMSRDQLRALGYVVE